MGQVASQNLKSSSYRVSFLRIENRGDVEAIGGMAVKFKNIKVSVFRPSKIFWVGVLMKRNGWIHTGVGLHNDVTVNFGDGSTRKYKYLVADGVSTFNDQKFKVNLTIANDLSEIRNCLAEAFNSEVDWSFSPVFAGDSWTTNRSAQEVVTHIERFLGLSFKMSSPGPGETNCVHFSVSMYLFFAGQRESELRRILGKVSHLIGKKDLTPLLNKLERELNEVDTASHPSGNSANGSCIIL